MPAKRKPLEPMHTVVSEVSAGSELKIKLEA